MKDKIKLLFFLSKLGKCESGYPKDKVCRTEEYIRSLPLLRENSSKEEPKKPDTLILKEVTLPKQKIDNKSNIVSKKIKTEDKENYKIVYDKNYTGIKKRNTPAEEIQNYVINIEDIINEKDTRTTLMIKNLPPNTNQVELLEKINYNHKDDYNFFYLPIDFTTKSNAGYAFINFKSAKSIINFFLEFNNKPWGFKNSNKIAYVSYARIQGFRALSSHFKKSHIMKQVDGKVKPMIIN
jgi:RNA recognition motif-containing protein